MGKEELLQKLQAKKQALLSSDSSQGESEEEETEENLEEEEDETANWVPCARCKNSEPIENLVSYKGKYYHEGCLNATKAEKTRREQEKIQREEEKRLSQAQLEEQDMEKYRIMGKAMGEGFREAFSNMVLSNPQVSVVQSNPQLIPANLNEWIEDMFGDAEVSEELADKIANKKGVKKALTILKTFPISFFRSEYFQDDLIAEFPHWADYFEALGALARGGEKNYLSILKGLRKWQKEKVTPSQ